MHNEITLLKELIDDNMVDVSDADYSLSHIIIGDTLGLWSNYLPCCVIIPKPSQVIPQYIGQDTDRENILVRFYVSAGHGENSAADTSTGMMKLIAMCEMLRYLIRKDPTFSSRMITCQINEIDYSVPLTGESNVARCAEVSVSCLARRLWEPPT